jgi:type VI secretion system protein ImpL
MTTTIYIVLAVILVALIVLVVVYLLQRRKRARLAAAEGEAAASGGGAADEISLLIKEAESRLSAAKLEHGARVGNLPVYLLMGDPGSTKTSVMLHSGLEHELLAGQVYQNNNVVSTRTANVWFSRRVLFVEAGGMLPPDAPRWKRLVQKLQPRSSVVGKGEQAPRAAVVCFDSEIFTKPGAPDLAVNAARNLRTRLGEISQTMGINLPVYVLFTKMDRIPYFAEFVRNLSNDEATHVLGATVPMVIRRSEGVYAEEESTRLTVLFERLFRTLADARPELLVRETDASKLPAAYEFPREFRKIRQTVVQFLVDLCRPSQLTVGPFLRGFYFTGVRPVVINEAAPVAAPAAGQPGGYGSASGATGIFNVGALAQQPARPAAPAVSTRKVPQWLFLSHFFNDILLADRAAMAASGSSTRTSGARRLLFLAGAVLCLVLIAGTTVSFFRNHALEARVREASLGISSGDSSGSDLPSLDGLRKLDTLRQSLETVVQYRHEGAPWSYRWGLYSGDDLYPEARRIYFDRFKQLLFASTQNNILQSLRGLPATPGPEYGPTYDSLKAYLVTTSHHDKSTRLFLSPVLLKWWLGGRTVDPERTQLAQKQFDFYAGELKEENPYAKENDSFAIDKARKYLAQFAGAERVYAFMLAEAGKNNPPINFNRQYPGSAQVLVETHEVPGAFSKGGWAFMKDAVAHPDRYFSGEQWVLGDQAAANIDLGKLGQDVKTRFYADFVKEWRTYLKSASVLRYAGLKDASQKLVQLSGNQSPLLEWLAVASQNTSVDDPGVAAVFQPAQAVVPPGSTDRFIAPPNQNYMNALVALQASIESIADQPPNDATAAGPLNNATQAKVTTRQMAQTFRIDADGHIEASVQKVLEDPIVYTEALLRTLGPAELNGKGKGLCNQFRTLMTRFPFNPASSTDATLAEVNGVFRKPDGALWTFYDQNLQKLLPKQGAAYVPATAGGVTLSQGFVNFFNAAAGFSDAVYAAGAQDPRINYTLKPEVSEGIQTVSLHIDGQAISYSGGTATPKQFTWQGGGVHEAKATVKFGGGPDLEWSNDTGVWAVFQLFAHAERWQPASQGSTLEWVIRVGKGPMLLPNGKPLTVRFTLDMGGAPPIFQRGYFSRMACVAEVAR